MGRAARRLVFVTITASTMAGMRPALADARQEACKAAMNDRIQACTKDCTDRALAAVPDYKDTNHNVMFGCLKGCAIGQIMQMRHCVAGENAPPADPTETNH